MQPVFWEIRNSLIIICRSGLVFGHMRSDCALSGLTFGNCTLVSQGFAAVLTDFALSGLSIKKP
jgi:hypothetical protein